MKKLFTLIVAVFAALSMNAAVEVGNETFSYGQPISLNGGWEGRYHNLTADFNFDASAYDYVWIQVENFSGKVNFSLAYNEWTGHQSWGDVFETASKTIEGVTGGVFGIEIEKNKKYVVGDTAIKGKFIGDTYDKHLRQVSVQDQGTASKLTVVGVWFGTKAEYEAALAGNKPVIDPIKELDPKAATNGWGDKKFSGFTQVGVINAKDAAIGWWLDGTDASNYDNFVVELEKVEIPESTDAGTGESNKYAQLFLKYQYETGEVDDKGKPIMKYVEETFPFDQEGSVTIVAPLNAQYKSNVVQIAIQGSAGLTFKIVKAYFATEEKTPTGISNAVVAPKANPNAPIYNLAGQKVSKAYKGVVIQNGKKFVQK